MSRFSDFLPRVYVRQNSKILGPTDGQATAWAVNSPINWYITYHWYDEYIYNTVSLVVP